MAEASQTEQDTLAGQEAERTVIELASVRKVYEDGNVEALKGVSLKFSAGEYVSIMGPSGCGKSTLLNMLGALDKPTSGTVTIEGALINERTNLDRIRSQRIGFVFQSFYLLPNLTALENVQLPMFESELPLAERVQRATKLLEIVGLEQRVAHLPKQLSIGQRQRVAIARALANDPAIVLADEPTGSLDSQSGREVMELFTKLNKEQGTTLVMVTHDEAVAAYAARSIRMFDGEIQDDRPRKS